MDIIQVMNHLPHRYPFLLVDRVLGYEAGQSLTAIKNVTFNEPYFQGHFPGKPVMPGVLIIEALAQATGLLAFATREQGPDENFLYLLVSVDKARFKRQVEPGDQLTLNVELMRKIKDMWRFEGVAKVGDQVVASAVLMCAERRAEP